AAAPIHHVHHRVPNDDHGCRPAAHRLTTPTVAPMAVLTTAPPTTTAIVYRSQFADASVATNRRTANAAAAASSVLPDAAASPTIAGWWLVTFARNAPTRTPGHTSAPTVTSAASDRPLAEMPLFAATT